MPTKKNYCLLMKRMRKKKGLTQASAASYLSYSLQAYAKYESGESEMGLSCLVDLSRLFEIDVDSFLEGVERKENSYADIYQFDADLFSKRLVYYRKKKKLTQAELADLCLCSTRSIKNYEACHSVPGVDTLILMKETFGVAAADLIFPLEYK